MADPAPTTPAPVANPLAVKTLVDDVADIVTPLLPKSFIASLTIWGGVLGAVTTVMPPLLAVFGLSTSPVTTVVMGSLAALMTFIGRINATQTINIMGAGGK